MSWFHSHNWMEVERIKAVPLLKSFDRLEGKHSSIERFCFRVTTIILECTECHDKKTIEILGESTTSTKHYKTGLV